MIQAHHFTPEAQELLRQNLKPFLAVINNCSEAEAFELPLCWQVFPEIPELRGLDFLDAVIYQGSAQKYWKRLLDWNADGYHVGLCTSRMGASITGKPYRDKAHVKSFHYLAVDLDMKDRNQEIYPELPTYQEALATFAPLGSQFAPSALVCSGHGFHLYFALETPQNAGNWPSILRARLGLWQHFQDWGADKSLAVDSAKCLRLPGTQNLKYEPTPCRVMQICHTAYKLEDLISAFPYTEPIKPEIQKAEFDYKPTLPTQAKAQMAYEWLLEQEPAIERCGGSNACLKAAWVGPRFCLDYDLALELLMRFYNPTCEPEWSEFEMRHKLDSAYESAAQLGFYGCGMPDYKLQSDMAFLKAHDDMFGDEDE